MRRTIAGGMIALIMVGEAKAACDPHYRSEVCVPIASDVDCWPGSGNGPEYVSGPFEYEGEDVHDLDRDHDGVACEPPPDEETS